MHFLPKHAAYTTRNTFLTMDKSTCVCFTCLARYPAWNLLMRWRANKRHLNWYTKAMSLDISFSIMLHLTVEKPASLGCGINILFSDIPSLLIWCQNSKTQRKPWRQFRKELGWSSNLSPLSQLNWSGWLVLFAPKIWSNIFSLAYLVTIKPYPISKRQQMEQDEQIEAIAFHKATVSNLQTHFLSSLFI